MRRNSAAKFATAKAVPRILSCRAVLDHTREKPLANFPGPPCTTTELFYSRRGNSLVSPAAGKAIAAIGRARAPRIETRGDLAPAGFCGRDTAALRREGPDFVITL
jgi:hypothetical protein